MIGILTELGLAALGLIVGLLVGMTSVGSGALMTPILLLDFSSVVGKILVVGTSTTYGTVLKSFGSAQNYLKKALNFRYAFFISITGVPLAAIGAFYSSALINWNLFSPLLAVVLIIVAVIIVVQSKLEKLDFKKDPKITKTLRIKGLVVGVIVGLIAGLTGVSTGSLLVASLILIMNFPNRTAVNMAIFEGGLILFAATLTQIYLGHVNFLVTGILLVGGIPGILVGGHLKDKVDQKKLGYLIAAVIIFESARTLSAFLFGKSFFIF